MEEIKRVNILFDNFKNLAYTRWNMLIQTCFIFFSPFRFVKVKRCVFSQSDSADFIWTFRFLYWGRAKVGVPGFHHFAACLLQLVNLLNHQQTWINQSLDEFIGSSRSVNEFIGALFSVCWWWWCIHSYSVLYLLGLAIYLAKPIRIY